MLEGVRVTTLAALLAALFAHGVHAAAPGRATWTMVDVTTVPGAQADAHLVEMPGGVFYLLDAGDANGRLASYLRSRRVRVLEKVIISHAHKDHYSGLRSLVLAGMVMKEVRANLPDREACDTERPWGCDWDDFNRTLQLVTQHGAPVRPVLQGDRYYDRDGVLLEALYAYDARHTPIGRTDVNDTSVLLALSVGKTRALFTGDLNMALGTYLARQGKGLAAQLLKVPHHGTDSLAPNEFFDAVGAVAAFVPSPRVLWQSERSRRAREYFGSRGIPTYVSGIAGDVSIELRPDGFAVPGKSVP